MMILQIMLFKAKMFLIMIKIVLKKRYIKIIIDFRLVIYVFMQAF